MIPHDLILMQCSGLCESCRLWFVTPTSSARPPMSHRYASFPVRAGPLRMPVLQSRATCADPCGLFAVWPDSWPCSLVPESASANSRRQKALEALPSVAQLRHIIDVLPLAGRTAEAQGLCCSDNDGPRLCQRQGHCATRSLAGQGVWSEAPARTGLWWAVCTEKRHPYDRKASHFTGLPASVMFGRP